MSPPFQQTVFLDRDGTLNENLGYLDDPSKLKLLPAAATALKLLRETGFRLIVVSNQSGVSRGLIEKGALHRIHEKLNELLGAPYPMIEHFRICPHRPDEDCFCRKPHPKLLIDAASELGVAMAGSFMVGDRLSDLVAGRNAGCQASILVRTGDGLQTESKLKEGEADFVAENLEDAARWIISKSSGKSV